MRKEDAGRVGTGFTFNQRGDLKRQGKVIQSSSLFQSAQMSNHFRDLLVSVRSGKLAFFVGVGISYDSPGNMPLGMDLKKYPFEALATRQYRLGTRLGKLVSVGSKVTLTDFSLALLRSVFLMVNAISPVFTRSNNES
jgi:hypothetical protein